jgi:hypothetical protein
LTLSPPAVPGSQGTPQNLQIVDDAMAIGGGQLLPTQVYSTTFTLTTASTNITYTVGRASSLLFLQITQDATGGRAVTYGSEFVNPITNISSVPNANTFQIFISDGAYWKRWTTDFTA